MTSARFWGDYAMTWLYDLHYTRRLDQPGRLWATGLMRWRQKRQAREQSGRPADA